MPPAKGKKKRSAKRRKKQDRAVVFSTVLALVILAAFAIALILLLHAQQEKDAAAEVPEEAAAPVSTYTWNDGRIVYTGDECTAVTGIDVSGHQGDIDWTAAAADGISFAYIRIGYRGYGSEGNMLPDSFFEINYSGAQEAGLQTGIYFYSQAVTEEEAIEEANLVLELLGDRTPELPIVFDWERPAVENARTEHITSSEVASFCRAFCGRIEEAGYSAGIYMNRNKLELVSAYGLPDDAMIWVAQYSDAPTSSADFTIWQYTNTGSVQGISTDVDLDIMLLPADSTAGAVN